MNTDLVLLVCAAGLAASAAHVLRSAVRLRRAWARGGEPLHAALPAARRAVAVHLRVVFLVMLAAFVSTAVWIHGWATRPFDSYGLPDPAFPPSVWIFGCALAGLLVPVAAEAVVRPLTAGAPCRVLRRGGSGLPVGARYGFLDDAATVQAPGAAGAPGAPGADAAHHGVQGARHHASGHQHTGHHHTGHHHTAGHHDAGGHHHSGGHHDGGGHHA